jgi:hypothetical protein
MKNCTIGALTVEGKNFHCFTLELPDRDNKPNISCIPAGTYKAHKRHSPSNGNCIELENVANRQFIQIHAGNFTRDILGCILVGRTISDINGDNIPDVTSSKATLNELLRLLPGEFTVTVERV